MFPLSNFPSTDPTLPHGYKFPLFLIVFGIEYSSILRCIFPHCNCVSENNLFLSPVSALTNPFGLLQWLQSYCFPQIVWLQCRWFSRLPWSWQEQLGNRQSKMPPSPWFLLRFSLSCIKCSFGCCKSLLNFQSTEIYRFSYFLISYSIIPEVPLLIGILVLRKSWCKNLSA